jgi:hypothetical protein
MAAMSEEQKTADKVYKAIGHTAFDPKLFAFYLSRCGYLIQFQLWKVVRGLVEYWSADFDNGNDRGSPDYYRLTHNARLLLDEFERQDILQK